MTLFDVNVLIYAHRRDQEHHDFYREWLERSVRESAGVGVSALVAGGFLRIVTHRDFPNGPTPLPQAIAVVESLLDQSSCYWIVPTANHWRLLADLCRRVGATGKQVADAQHAAICIEHAARWVTRDDDFLRFGAHGLRVEMLHPPA